jgi:hypothetical protein
MGLGTGLNAFLTAIEAQKQERKIRYIAVERFPINPPEVKSFNYPDLLGHADLFQKIHGSQWNGGYQ